VTGLAGGSVDSSMWTTIRIPIGLAAATTAIAVGTVGLTAVPAGAAEPPATFVQINQVSDRPGQARLTDPDLINPWGLAVGPSTSLWVANEGTDRVTTYSGGLAGASVTKGPLTVLSDSEGITGQVFNPSTDFRIASPTGQLTPARFIFASTTGEIIAWHNLLGTHAVVVARRPGAAYTGLALWETALGRFLLAANFAEHRVDVFDHRFRPVDLDGQLFRDRHLPVEFAPFNVMTQGERVIVAYAKHENDSDEEATGPGLGYLTEFTAFGTRARRLVSRGPLNAPWGMTIAPAGFGHFGGALLVGNFGDGRINVIRGDRVVGMLCHRDHHPIEIEGLWALLPGTTVTGGTNTVWFSAGPDDERHGLVGQLVPVT
jgi:uncharacterized protein (TIGR03118 family)